jgi:cytochrome c oxidase subunit 3
VTATHAGSTERTTEHAEPRDSRLAVGTVLFLTSETLLFAGLLGSYFSLGAANDVWPPEGVDLDVVRAATFTGLFAVSALTMWLSLRAARAGRHAEADRWALLTGVIGVAFVVNTVADLATLDFGIDTDSYGSIFFITIGLHALHVVAGLVVLAAAVAVTFGRGRAPVVSTRAATAYYWWFTVILSLVVFAVFYLIK